MGKFCCCHLRGYQRSSLRVGNRVVLCSTAKVCGTLDSELDTRAMDCDKFKMLNLRGKCMLNIAFSSTALDMLCLQMIAE
jgi:hypothetical protein